MARDMSRFFLPILFLALAAQCFAQGMSSNNAAPAARLKPSGRPFPVKFTDVSLSSGLRALSVSGNPTNKKFILEANGSGVAFIDYDNDGWDDIFLVNGTQLNAPKAGGNYLFRNDHGRFVDVTKAAGMERTGWGNGACSGDINHDGFEDLFVTYYGANVLYRNTGKGGFRAEVWPDKGEWSTGCAFLDYNRDGHLDLVVSRYVGFDLAKAALPGTAANCLWKGTPVFCGPRGLPKGGVTLYKGKQDGSFEDVTESTGAAAATNFYGFTTIAADLNHDGFTDIYIASDSSPSIFLRNNGNGTFAELGTETGLAFSEHGFEQGGMGVAVGDFDNDGRLDLIKTNFAGDYPNLYRNIGAGIFEDVVVKAGLAVNPQYVGWGVGFVDFDNDGWLDVFQANGHVFPGLAKEPYKNPRLLYRNLTGGKFEDVSTLAGLTQVASSRGTAFSDFDNDGDIDVLIMNMHEPPTLLRNDNTSTNSWLDVLLKGNALGATVTLEAGGRKQAQALLSQSSFLSINSKRLHFGLGSVQKVDSLTVTWPSGRTEQFSVEALNRVLSIEEGKGKP